MNKEFIPYEEALALKELGFDKECFRYYVEQMDGTFILTKYKPYYTSIIAAPLYQQAFRWFREKYDITQTITRDGSLAKKGPWAYTIVYDVIYFNDGHLTYEEAELACLRKLIEIVKENDNSRD